MTKAEPTQTTDHLRDQELICSAGAVPSWGIYPSLLKAMAAARAEERERCAQIARSWKCDPLLDNEGNMGDLADAIKGPADAK